MVGDGEKPPPGIGENVAPDSSGDSIVLGDINTAQHVARSGLGAHIHLMVTGDCNAINHILCRPKSSLA